MNKTIKRIPLNGTFELTGRCNLSCKMCLVRVDQKRIRELKLRERTADEWINMAEQASKAGTLGLLLTGGEAMLRPDFCEIYEAIAQMGFLLTVYTNATIVTDKVMDVFCKYPPHKIGVTMYGASNDTYERLCGCADGYNRFVDGVEKLSSLPSLFETRTTIVKDNRNDLEAMQRFTKEKFGEDKILQISRFVTKSIRGGVADAEECRLSPEENIKLIYRDLSDVHQKIVEGKLSVSVPGKLPTYSKKIKQEGRYLFDNCNAGIDQYTITWDGRMFACELMADGYTNPFEEGFSTAWERLPEQYPVSQKIETCENCRCEAFCETCPAVKKAETGDWFGVPKYFCGESKFLYQILSDLKVIKKGGTLNEKD